MVRELIAIFGRRAGKSLALAVFDCWIAVFCDHRDVLAPGETGIVLCISRDQRIARVIVAYIEGILHASPNCAQRARSGTHLPSTRTHKPSEP